MINQSFNNINHPSLLYGSGFALNVYLPALISLGTNKIFINKNIISNASENIMLEKYKEYILYRDEEEYKDQLFNYIIFAVQPSKQYSLIFNKINLKNTNTLILEKPIASSPVKAQEIFERLKNLKSNYLINYSFRYAIWYKKLLTQIHHLPVNVNLFFTWQFRAKHFIHKRKTWKKFHSEGGGSIRFYGIHLIAILSDLGYVNIEESKISYNLLDDLSCFSCSLNSTENLPKCTLLVNSNSDVREFSCYYLQDKKKIKLLDLNEPISSKNGVLEEDPRIDITKQFLQDKNFHFNNLNVIKLWKSVEEKIPIK